jgi:hypothetical protein
MLSYTTSNGTWQNFVMDRLEADRFLHRWQSNQNYCVHIPNGTQNVHSYKKQLLSEQKILAGIVGIGPTPEVLETHVLPLYYIPNTTDDARYELICQEYL